MISSFHTPFSGVSLPITMFAKAAPLLAFSSLALQAGAVSQKHWTKRAEHVYLPKEINDYEIATAPNNVSVRYKNPGICETTPGVNSYSGYVDLAPNVRSISSCNTRETDHDRFTSFTGSSSLETIQQRIPSHFGSMEGPARIR